MRTTFDCSGRSAFPLLITSYLSVALFGCASSSEQPAVFGGEGASFEAKQTPLSEAPEDEPSGPCAKPAPPSDVVLIEDFEDADNQMFKGFEREGWWYVAVDETQGTVFPDVGDFKATALPPEDATMENRFALHGKADGYRDWGVVWGTTTRWVNEGMKCPLNASKFEGMTFRVKGTGSIHLKIGNPKTVPGEYEGWCKEKCWDTHGYRFPLTEDWRQIVVRWDRVQQGGWGAQAKFDPERLLTLNFSVDGKDLPVEFWLDDILFLEPGKPVPTLVPAKTVPAPTDVSTSTPPADGTQPAAAPNSASTPAPGSASAPKPSTPAPPQQPPASTAVPNKTPPPTPKGAPPAR